MSELSEYVTAAMLSRETGIGKRTIIDRIHRQKIPTEQLGNVLAIKRTDAARITHKPYKGERK